MPDWKNEIRKHLSGLNLSATREHEIIEELSHHLEDRYRELSICGLTDVEAYQSALAELSDIETLALMRGRHDRPANYEPEIQATNRRGNMIADLWQDLRYGARMILKQPGFTMIAVFTLALGIGANTAIFSVVNAVLLQPLPYPKAEELVGMYCTPGGDVQWPYSPVDYLELKQRATVFSDIAAISNKGWSGNLTGLGEPERLRGFQVSFNIFSLLGAVPAHGRFFFESEDHPGANNVVVISDELWRRRFAADPNIVGQLLTLNGESYKVIGITHANFRFYTKTDVWTPLAFTAKDENDKGGYLDVFARRKPEASFEQAQAEIDGILRGSGRHTDQNKVHARLTLPQSTLTQEVRPMLLLLIAAVGFVLLISCVNIANLLLARGNARRRELAIRSAMGAGRFRLARQLMAENALLALIGGSLGLLMAAWGIRFIISGLPEYLANTNSRVATLQIDTTALAFTLGLSFLTSIVFGLVPAIQLSRIDLNESIKEGGLTALPRNRLRSALVIAEVALAIVLLAGAGLMIKSFWRLSHVDLGYQPEGVLTARIDPSGDNYKSFELVTGFYRNLLERVSAIPGVRSASVINSLNASDSYSIDEHPPVSADKQPSVSINQVSDDYFKTMGIPLRAGRFFNDRDVKEAPQVIIINDTLARQEFTNETPIGKHLSMENKSWEIVGVVGSARYWNLTDKPYPHIFFPYQQENWWSMNLVVRTQSGDPTILTGPIRAELAKIDKNQPIHSFGTYEKSVSEMLGPQRFTTTLMAGFAALAALLAAIGIYGVMSYSVTQRTREIGVRMALGAQTDDVLRMVLGQGLTVVGIGVAIGIGGALLLTRMLTTLLFNVSATDPMTFVAISAFLVVVALFACCIPARRAMRVDPMVALRYE